MLQAMQVAQLVGPNEMSRAEAQELLGLSPSEMRAAFKRLEKISGRIDRDQD